METVKYFQIIILQILLHQAALSTEAMVSSMFVEKGQNVLLDVPGHVECKEKMDSNTLFIWKFNNRENVVIYSTKEKGVYFKNEGRVTFSEVNLSLLRENVQEGDSGSYTAVLSGEKDTTVAEHQISVQARVEPPHLTVDSVSFNNDTCNVTVICRGQNTTVTSICNNHTCSQGGAESSGSVTSTVSLLSVYMAEDTIICNHSNQVSWAKDTNKIELICVSVHPGPKFNREQSHTAAIVVPIIIVLLIIIFLVIYHHHRKQNKSGKRDTVNTDYASVEASGNGGAGVGQVIQCSGPERPTIYSVVQHVNSPTMQGEPAVEQPMTHKPPESVYAMVEKNPSRH